MKNQNITIITANYYPEDTAIGLYTTQFSKFLITKNYSVTVITGFPCYPQWSIYDEYRKKASFMTENIDGVQIIRYKQYVPKEVNFKGRVLMMLSMVIGVFINIFKIRKTSLVICIVPYTISLLPALILSKLKRAKFWIHIQDFEFDLALDSGIVKNENVLSKILKKGVSFFERSMLNSSNVSSSISLSMLNKIRVKSNHKEPFYFPNWVSSEKINPHNFKQHPFISEDKFTLLYSGNIGEKQDWSFLNDLCNIMSNEDNIEIVIVGNGGYCNTLKSELKNCVFVRFFEPVPYRELNDLLCSVNAHFLFQKNDVVDTIMPSKILGMMASAKPSIITGNEVSEVKTIINQSEGGYYFYKNNAQEVYETILLLKNNTILCTEIGKKARYYITEKFSEKNILENFHQKINTLF